MLSLTNMGQIPGFIPPPGVHMTPPVGPYSLAGPYTTQLQPQQESNFKNWVQQNHIPWQDSPTADYDMRGFWQAQQSGSAQQAANRHFPDTWKTPYHKTFSNESRYAISSAPKWKGNRLIDSTGKVIADESK